MVTPTSKRVFLKLIRYAIPCVLFGLFFSVRILDPRNISWLLHDDWGQHFLGWHAFRQAPLVWPFNREYLLAAPKGLSLLFTDSNPLVALPLRLISGLLPPVFQYIGLWFLLCLFLHFHIAWKLVRRYAPGSASALAGATLLSLLPTLYNRVEHDTLMAHWIILWAIYVFFNISSARTKLYHYGWILFLASLIHPYLLVIVLAIWGGEQLSSIAATAGFRLVGRNLSTQLQRIAAGVVPAILGLTLSGAFDGSTVSGGTFGESSMSLDAPFNPVRTDFPLAFLRGGHYNGQAFEGFQYLGLGVLVLLVAGCYTYKTSPRINRSECHVFYKARALLIPYAALLLLAVSNHVRVYQKTLVKIPLPHQVVDVVGVVRCSGRLFWPLAYTAVFLALLVLYRTSRKRITVTLAIVTLLQIVDMSRFAFDVRKQTASKQTYTYTLDPRWDTLISNSDKVLFMPAYAIATAAHKNFFFEIAYRSLTSHTPVNAMYAARDNPEEKRLQKTDFTLFQNSFIDPHHLYLLPNNCTPPPGFEDRVRVLDGMWFIPPTAEASLVTETPQASKSHIGELFTYDENSSAACQLDTNWSEPESGWVWGEGSRSSLRISFDSLPLRNLTVQLRAATYANGKPLEILANGVPITQLVINREPNTFQFTIPRENIHGNSMNLTFVVEPMQERERARKGEARRLGVRLYSMGVY